MSSVEVTKKEETGDNAVQKVEGRSNWNFPTIFGRTAWDDIVGSIFGDFDRFFGRDQVVQCYVIQNKDSIEESFEDGVLSLKLPVIKTSEARRIEVQ